MNKILDDYLEKTDKYLRPLTAAERADIINEIKSEMYELQNKDGLLPEQIAERLGDPKELAKAYLGESLSKNSSFGWKELGAVIAFYGLAGIGSTFILPVISILAVSFMFFGVAAPICGMIKFLGSLIGMDVPFVIFQAGSYVAPPFAAFLYSVVIGVLLFFAGRGLWKLTVKYIRMVSTGKRKLQER